jgi:protein TonB
MTRDINITGKEWLELVFAGRNKSYGAYAIRHSTTRRHVTAYFIIIAFVAAIMVFPLLRQWIAPARSSQGLTEVTQISSIVLDPPTNSAIQNTVTPPPAAALKQTIKFTVFKPTENVTDETAPPVIDEITTTNAAVSFITQAGDPGGTALPELPVLPPTPETDTPILEGVVEQRPVFPYDLMKWIYKELKYPSAAIEVGIAGRVTMQFTVGKDGAVRDIEVMRGVHSLLDNEALRVLGKMPKWIPGKQQGNPVSVRYVIPIIFKIAER